MTRGQLLLALALTVGGACAFLVCLDLALDHAAPLVRRVVGTTGAVFGLLTALIGVGAMLGAAMRP